MNKEQFIEIYIAKRNRIRTHNLDLMKRIFAEKYSRWMMTYFNHLGIDEVPQMLCCNTLHKLPSTIDLNGISFFVMDHALFDYFYDLNYVFYDESRKDYLINVCVKHYIEACYAKGQIDRAYYFACTSPDIEAYKSADDYYSEQELTYWSIRAEVQEELTYLHEADHYYLKQTHSNSWKNEYEEILRYQFDDNSSDPAIPEPSFDSVLTECFCDGEALKYMMTEFSEESSLELREYISLLYKVPVYLHILRCIDAAVLDSGNISSYYDETFVSLTYRMGMMYYVIRQTSEDVSFLDMNRTVFMEQSEFLTEAVATVRSILQFCSELYIENNDRLSAVTEEEKEQYVREYLNLL